MTFSVLMACYFCVFFQCGSDTPFSAFSVKLCTFRVPKGSPADIFLKVCGVEVES